MSGLDSLAKTPGDSAAGDFEALLTEHQRRIYFFIRSMVFDPEDARDVLQDVNIVIVRKRDHFQPGTDFKSWAFAIARFECLTYLARRKRLQWTALESETLEHLAIKAEERAEDVETWLHALAECRRMLSPESSELLDLRYDKHEMLEAVAERWGTSVGALKQKLFRIRAFLKNCILKRRQGEISGSEAESP